jgi:hypothetical protein
MVMAPSANTIETAFAADMLAKAAASPVLLLVEYASPTSRRPTTLNPPDRKVAAVPKAEAASNFA